MKPVGGGIALFGWQVASDGQSQVAGLASRLKSEMSGTGALATRYLPLATSFFMQEP